MRKTSFSEFSIEIVKMMSPEENRNELYFSENDAGSRPWWDVPSYLNGPIRFGTFDGVFVSVFFNIFHQECILII